MFSAQKQTRKKKYPRHTRKQESMAHPLEGKKQIKGTVPGKDLMSDLLIKDVKIIV